MEKVELWAMGREEEEDNVFAQYTINTQQTFQPEHCLIARIIIFLLLSVVK